MRVATREEIEEAVAAVWKTRLGVARLNRDDDFYALGGHSLLAVRSLLDIGEATGIVPHLPSFVGKTTVARVADTFWEIGRRQLR